MNKQITLSDGSKEWYQNGLLHRDNDLPARIYPGGEQQWYQQWYQNGTKMVKLLSVIKWAFLSKF